MTNKILKHKDMKTRTNSMILVGILVAALAFWSTVSHAATIEDDAVKATAATAESELMETVYNEIQLEDVTDHSLLIKIYDAENNLLFEGKKDLENKAYLELTQQADLLFRTYNTEVYIAN